MSYIGRITGRMRGGREAPALLPAGRVASPLANSDQRLHLIGAGGFGRAEGRGGAVGEDDPFTAAGALESAPGAAAGSGGARVEAPADRSSAASQAPSRGAGSWSAAAPGEREAPAVAVDGGASSSSRPIASTSSLARAEPVSGARDSVQALVGPRPTHPSDAPSSAPAGSDAANPRATVHPASAAPQREAPQREPGRPQASGAAPGDTMAGALADALGQVSRWMASEPRERPAPRAPAAADVFGPRREAPVVSAPKGAGAHRGRDGTAGFAAAAGLSAVAARPRLTVGRIDVQIVAPPAPAAIAPARPARSAPPASTSGPSPAPYLSFGLRQR